MSARAATKAERRLALRQGLRSLRSLEREVAVLRVALADMLEQEEKAALCNYPLADHRGPARLNGILAREMTYGYGADVHRADLRRIKAARRALGLPAWWDLP